MEYVSWGPWPLGQDNVHQPFDSVFRARDGKPARLRRALNVDMLDSGWPRSRGKVLEVLTGTAFNSVFPFAGYLLMQDGGTITAYDEDFNDTELVTGLTATAGSFHSFGAQCFYTNGTDVGRIVLGDEIIATAEQVSITDKIAVYYISITNHLGKTVALFKGTVYRTSRNWEL